MSNVSQDIVNPRIYQDAVKMADEKEKVPFFGTYQQDLKGILNTREGGTQSFF